MLISGCKCGLHGKPLCMNHEARKRLDGCALSRKPSRLPYKPPKPYIPEVKWERKAMTIAVGFECREGFVLGADRQMSHGTAKDIGAFAHYEQKVFGHEALDFAVSICGAGNDGSFLKPFAESFLEESSEHLKKDGIGQTRSVLESSLNEFTVKIGGTPDFLSDHPKPANEGHLKTGQR